MLSRTFCRLAVPWAKWLIISADKNIQYVLAWKRGNAVLTAGNVKVTMNPRIRLIPVHELPEVNGASAKSPTGYNLELRDVRTVDAGEYACQIGTLEPQEIVHKLEVLVPPKIDFTSPTGGRLDVAKSSPIRLECRGSGNPTPKIYWSRKVRLSFFFFFCWGNTLIELNTKSFCSSAE